MDNAYALAQWSQALVTAATTTDDATRARARAQRRMTQWEQVVSGLRSGVLRLGSRTPVRGLPAWVTPEVVRGGFATGRPVAAGPLTELESRLAREAGVPEDRAALVEHLITEPGIRRLWEILDAGTFEIDVPEAAALLVLAWLVREGDTDGALEVLTQILPFSGRLRFLPASASAPRRDPGVMWRESAGSVAAGLRRKQPNARVVRMNEVLDVWNPFADALLTHWTLTDDAPVGPFPAEWLDAGRRLLAEFDRLALAHTPPARHRNPKENAATLRLALAAVVSGRDLTPRERGRVRHAVAAMVARRGAPGSTELTTLRARQHAQAARPTVAALAHVAADRLASAAPDEGIDDTAPFGAPVTAVEASTSGTADGTPMPRTVARALLRAKAGTLRELIDGGMIPSAEVLATLVPQVTAQVVAEQYADPTLRTLMARSYEAFRRRRSLLLLDLQHQVRPEELPWHAATAARRQDTSATRDVARDTFLRLADEAIEHWPGVILPNPLVAELETLAAGAHLDVPLVQEIAADIFMGRFSAKYARTFELAASAYAGTLYARYYRIPEEVPAAVRRSAKPANAFGEQCAGRANTPGHHWCVTCNGMIVEQSQILTTHNLASLRAAGFVPRNGWRAAAEGAFAHAATLVARLDGNRSPRRMLKDIGYAWRQMVFAASQLDDDAQTDFIAWARADAHRRSPFARSRLVPLLDDLARPGTHEPLVGWSHESHRLTRTPG